MSPLETSRTAPVTFRHVTPVLRVENLTASLDYYVRVLGFRLNWRDDDGSSFASVSRDDCHLFLTVGDQGHVGSWMWIGISDAEQFYEECQANGVKVRNPPTNYFWALEMQVEDIDGNVLRMGSDPKEDMPLGDWLDMHGILWRPAPDGGWTRVN